MERWGNEKGEVEIEACDPEVLSIVVDYMYGMDLPSMVLNHISSFSVLILTPGLSQIWQDPGNLGNVLDGRPESRT